MNRRICRQSQEKCGYTPNCNTMLCNLDNEWMSKYFLGNCYSSDFIYSKTRMEKDVLKILVQLDEYFGK